MPSQLIGSPSVRYCGSALWGSDSLTRVSWYVHPGQRPAGCECVHAQLEALTHCFPSCLLRRCPCKPCLVCTFCGAQHAEISVRIPWVAGAPCAAAVLLSYLAYEFFGSSERTMVLRAVHSLASAAATAAPGLAFAALLPSGGCDLGRTGQGRCIC